jgi:hypothetical protein
MNFVTVRAACRRWLNLTSIDSRDGAATLILESLDLNLTTISLNAYTLYVIPLIYVHSVRRDI